MQIAEYFLLALSLIFGYKLGMGKGSWVYADSIPCEDWEGRISSYDQFQCFRNLISVWICQLVRVFVWFRAFSFFGYSICMKKKYKKWIMVEGQLVIFFYYIFPWFLKYNENSLFFVNKIIIFINLVFLFFCKKKCYLCYLLD